MTDFCSDELCKVRLRVAFYLPDDPDVIPPCSRCIAALADLLNVSATSMEDIKARVMEANVHA